jgi:hypothetical protein
MFGNCLQFPNEYVECSPDLTLRSERLHRVARLIRLIGSTKSGSVLIFISGAAEMRVSSKATSVSISSREIGMTFTMGGSRRTNTWVRIAPTIVQANN